MVIYQEKNTKYMVVETWETEMFAFHHFTQLKFMFWIYKLKNKIYL